MSESGPNNSAQPPSATSSASPNAENELTFAENATTENTAQTEQPTAPTERSTHFLFQHKLFTLSGAYFSMSKDVDEPVLNVLLGDLRASLPLPSLEASFGIVPDSPDGRMLKLVSDGLRFVKVIRPGESIPCELLDGTASWSVEDKHRIIARGRLTMQLVSWITGSETIVVDLAQLEQIMEDPLTKSRLHTAFDEINRRLGLGPDQKQEVNDRVDALAHELSYVEALRDRFGMIKTIQSKLVQASRAYRSDRTFTPELARMQGLIGKAVKEYAGLFEQADAQTGEIVNALKTFGAQIEFIRHMRDELHYRMMEWDDMIKQWASIRIERSPEIEHLLKHTYRFLAHKYIETKVWERPKGSY
ncbi:DUF2326 domain-containing protein [Azospirillaceae bacterium]